ncbi:expressed unknown protein [Seminavis robusta]|uniref:Uncharacterized protein n=1 Tax=Seminavis robusta TaxID=568900 RepID=A0A9N8HL68_9STRA|nr:expressed unknown protein [Seminavis robusta]|eukprot:Sro1006_g230300.1 n/a (389) ;mRNA; f:6581-7839
MPPSTSSKKEAIPGSSSGSNAASSGGTVATRGKKKTKTVKRLWLPWEFCKLIEPPNGALLPPFGCEKPSNVTVEEKHVIATESETLFPVGFYDMTPAKRGVTKGRGDWKGKEALRLAHCSAEKNGCRFKARFCRVMSGMEIFTSGTHDITAHLTPRKRGLAPAARAIVTKYKEESQSKLVEWLKDGGLLDGATNDLEKVKQQIKRRKMTLKRKQKRVSGSSRVEGGEETDASLESDEVEENGEEEEEDDPLCSAKINMLQDDSFVSLIDPPENVHAGLPRHEDFQSDEDYYSEGVAFTEAIPFGDGGPYSPTTVMIDDDSPSYSFHSMFETPPLLHANDIFPRNSHEYPLTHLSDGTTASEKREKAMSPPPLAAGMDPSGAYFQEAEV